MGPGGWAPHQLWSGWPMGVGGALGSRWGWQGLGWWGPSLP